MPSPTRKPHRKTPTPRYMAARLIADVLGDLFFVTAIRLEELFNTKISPKKWEDCVRHVKKLVGRQHDRALEIIKHFENPKPKENNGFNDPEHPLSRDKR